MDERYRYQRIDLNWRLPIGGVQSIKDRPQGCRGVVIRGRSFIQNSSPISDKASLNVSKGFLYKQDQCPYFEDSRFPLYIFII
jgi:hypothetical protein